MQLFGIYFAFYFTVSHAIGLFGGNNYHFAVIDPRKQQEIVTTEIFVHKYYIKPKQLKIYHSGIEINGVEYWFGDKDKVEETTNLGHPFGGLQEFGIDKRSVKKSLQDTLSTFNRVRDRWTGTKYRLLEHNCNFFTDDVLTTLGVEGLGHEMLDSHGMRQVLTYAPGIATVAELAKFLDGATPDMILVIGDLTGIHGALHIITDIGNNPNVKKTGDAVGDGLKTVGDKIGDGVRGIFG